MFLAARFCSSRIALHQTKVLFNKNTSLLPTTGLTRQLVQGPLKRTSLIISTLKKSVGTISIRLSVENAATRYKKAVGYWLFSCSGMVFVAVVLGGVTRLTESGLSMVTWRLLGESMPRTQDEWLREFKRYQQFPEFKIKNKDMTLTEFKRIWYMEYAHRMWGRAIGAVFLLPAAFFWARGAFLRPMKLRVLGYGSLIGAQGLMGWYMVKSGMQDRFHGENDVPRVSQYRLAAHLSLAFVLYSLLLWASLDHLLPAQTLTNVSKRTLAEARKIRMLAHTCKAMVFLTAISGAILAGLDGGLVYNSFPKMADKWIPDDILALKPTLHNFTENPTTAQFDHRLLGLGTLSAISALTLLARQRKLPPRAHLAANTLGAMVWVQVALGVSTLLMYVPIPLAASHQSGSLVLLSMAIWLSHELKRLPKI